MNIRKIFAIVLLGILLSIPGYSQQADGHLAEVPVASGKEVVPTEAPAAAESKAVLERKQKIKQIVQAMTTLRALRIQQSSLEERQNAAQEKKSSAETKENIGTGVKYGAPASVIGLSLLKRLRPTTFKQYRNRIIAILTGAAAGKVFEVYGEAQAKGAQAEIDLVLRELQRIKLEIELEQEAHYGAQKAL